MLNIRKITAVIACMACLVSFSEAEDFASDTESKNSVSQTISVGENGVTEIIAPAEDSEEYSLGDYRISESGIKLYYEEENIPTLERYFTSFQNRDFELYKTCLAADYVERYNKYLIENYSHDGEEYTLQNSFELQCDNIRNFMIEEILNTDEVPEDDTHTGDFKITRIRAEESELLEGETTDSLVEKYFDYLDGVFDMDYYNYISEQADGFKYFTFYVIAEGEDGEEHRIISAMDIVFAEKDGKYYTFG